MWNTLRQGAVGKAAVISTRDDRPQKKLADEALAELMQRRVTDATITVRQGSWMGALRGRYDDRGNQVGATKGTR